MSEYCGFSCADILEKQQEIIDDLVVFQQYNPEFSKVMVGKLLNMFDKVNTSG